MIKPLIVLRNDFNLQAFHMQTRNLHSCWYSHNLWMLCLQNCALNISEQRSLQNCALNISEQRSLQNCALNISEQRRRNWALLLPSSKEMSQNGFAFILKFKVSLCETSLRNWRGLIRQLCGRERPLGRQCVTASRTSRHREAMCHTLENFQT